MPKVSQLPDIDPGLQASADEFLDPSTHEFGKAETPKRRHSISLECGVRRAFESRLRHLHTRWR
jgi:hypothetical protein